MVNDKMSKLDRLEEAINEDILAMTPEDALEEARPMAMTQPPLLKEWILGLKQPLLRQVHRA